MFTTMEKNVATTALTNFLMRSPLAAPPVTMTGLLHVQLEYAEVI